MGVYCFFLTTQNVGLGELGNFWAPLYVKRDLFRVAKNTDKHTSIAKRLNQFQWMENLPKGKMIPKYPDLELRIISSSRVRTPPLIDMKPSDPDTMMTAKIRAQQLMLNIGQNFLVLTCDQQLYPEALEITWTYPERFPDVVLRLGGMHA